MMYYHLYYYQSIHPSVLQQPFEALYVPSRSVRDNDPLINPLQVRLFTTVRGMAQTAATRVYVHFRSREIPYQSIIDHLFCPNSVTDAIGLNSQRYCQGVYMVRDAQAPAKCGTC